MKELEMASRKCRKKRTIHSAVICRPIGNVRSIVCNSICFRSGEIVTTNRNNTDDWNRLSCVEKEKKIKLKINKICTFPACMTNLYTRELAPFSYLLCFSLFFVWTILHQSVIEQERGQSLYFHSSSTCKIYLYILFMSR